MLAVLPLCQYVLKGKDYGGTFESTADSLYKLDADFASK